MSPAPILERQRALSRIGEIRTGGEKPSRGAGKKLEQFRLTSQQHDIIDRCAELYGGEPKPWKSPAGDAWQLYTEAEALPCLVVVGYSLSQSYELWEGASTWKRKCDGRREEFSEGPCICNANEKDECAITTRLMVVLPEAGTSLGWQLRSIGENAARELSGAMMMLEEVARGRAFVPANLRLTQRRSTINGQAVRYVVPVLDFDPRTVTERAAIEPGAAPLEIPAETGTHYTPVVMTEGPTPSEALDATARRQSAPRAGRAEPVGQAAPLPQPGTIEPTLDGEDTAPRSGAAGQGEPSSPSSVEKIRSSSEGQRTKEQDDADGRDVFGAPLDAESDSPFVPPGGSTVRKISDSQRRFLFGRCRDIGLAEDQIRDAIEEVTGQRSTAEIPADQFDAVLALCELKGQEGS